MDIVLLGDGGELQWPLTPELIAKIADIDASAVDADMSRAILRVFKGLRAKKYTGCTLFVHENGLVRREVYTFGSMRIGPNSNNEPAE
jgi:hypothetical protein